MPKDKERKRQQKDSFYAELVLEKEADDRIIAVTLAGITAGGCRGGPSLVIGNGNWGRGSSTGHGTAYRG